jgi:hypothetical protein
MAFAVRLSDTVTLFGVEIPSYVAPFASLVRVQIILWRASFIGHLAGIVAGFAVAFHLFDWFTDYLFFCALMWTFVGLSINVKQTTSVSMPWLEILDVNDTSWNTDSFRVVDG